MRQLSTATLFATILVLVASPAQAGAWEATVELGGIVLDEEGDKSTVQETYNIYDGFSVSGLRFSGAPVGDHYFKLDLTDINLDSRRGDFLYRKPGLLRVNASYDQHRQVFDPERAVASDRKDWNFGAGVTPAKWLSVTGYYNYLTREGDRLSFPAGTAGSLGTGYDYSLMSGGVGAEVRKNGRGFAVDYRASDYADDRNTDADRTGRVVSARVFANGFLYENLTHLLRAAYGVNDLPNRDVDYTLSTFRYTGALQPVRRFLFKYNFDAQRVDSQTTGLQTDRFLNLVDATYFHESGSVTGGYGYETNDDDRHLTSYHSWRAGATFRGATYSGKLDYAGRVKKDQEELTLLKDVEASRLRAEFEVKPVTGLVMGAGFHRREREYPDIRVESEGEVIRTMAGYSYPEWGGVSGNYSYTRDQYRDLAGTFDVNSHIVTGRIDLDRIPNLRLSTGVTYLAVGEDLDIEKSILFFEGRYTVLDDIHFEAKYNIYNYDDYILLDRYYTANVVWFNVAYDLHGE